MLLKSSHLQVPAQLDLRNTVRQMFKHVSSLCYAGQVDPGAGAAGPADAAVLGHDAAQGGGAGAGRAHRPPPHLRRRRRVGLMYRLLSSCLYLTRFSAASHLLTVLRC